MSDDRIVDAVPGLLSGSFSFDGEMTPELQDLVAKNPPILHAHFKRPVSRWREAWVWLTRPLRVKRRVLKRGELLGITETPSGFSAEIGSIEWGEEWVWRWSLRKILCWPFNAVRSLANRWRFARLVRNGAITPITLSPISDKQRDQLVKDIKKHMAVPAWRILSPDVAVKIFDLSSDEIRADGQAGKAFREMVEPPINPESVVIIPNPTQRGLPCNRCEANMEDVSYAGRDPKNILRGLCPPCYEKAWEEERARRPMNILREGKQWSLDNRGWTRREDRP